MLKNISKEENEWRAVAKGLQVLLSTYIADIHENGIPKNENNAYVSVASHFIAELTNELI